MAEYKAASGNTDFRISKLTWLALLTFLVFYPGISMLGFTTDPGELLRSMDEAMLMFVLIVTVLFQWFLFLINYVALFRERTGMAGIGLVKPRMVDFAWAIAFVLAANLVLSSLAWVLAQIGLPVSGEIGLMVPKGIAGKVVWVVVSFTAGFCEEVGFRGYLMTRLRLVFKTKTWIVPVIISSLAFGVCHAYQGVPGLILLTIYGAMFSLLYIRTGRLWPLIIAHSLQDLGALFFPQ